MIGWISEVHDGFNDSGAAEAVERGDFVRFEIPDSRVQCVVVREDLLDPMRLRTDFSPCDADDLSRLTAEVLDDEDWSIPEGHTSQESL